MSHLNQAHLNKFKICIEKCESTIDACQLLIGMCSVKNIDDCAEHVGKAIALCKDVVKACHECIEICDFHLDDCEEVECKIIFQKAVNLITGAASAADKVITVCKQKNYDCVNACTDCIKKLDACALACQNVIDLMNNKG